MLGGIMIAKLDTSKSPNTGLLTRASVICFAVFREEQCVWMLLLASLAVTQLPQGLQFSIKKTAFFSHETRATIPVVIHVVSNETPVFGT